MLSNEPRKGSNQEQQKPDIEKSEDRKAPRPHQVEALKDILAVLSRPGKDVRTTAVMAPGSGKTLVGLWASEQLGPRTLLLEPSLALIAQNLEEWRKNYSGEKPEFLVVCSDETVVNLNTDEAHITPEDLNARVTNDPKEIAEFCRGKGRRIVVSTYHSSPLLAAAATERNVPRFDCTVCDEAHRTAVREESAFTTALYQDQIPSRTRLFLTATPRIYRGNNGSDESVVSMDDEAIYGPRCHTLSFSNAVGQKILTDYRLVVAVLSSAEFQELKGLKPSEMKMAIAEIALLRAAEKYKLSKIITFHDRVSKAHMLADRLEYSAREYLPKKNVWVHAVNGKMPSRTREHLLDLFAEQRSSTLAVMANCQVLKEGVDIPAVDGVAFFDKKSSEIDIVQAIGRAMRRAPGKKLGTILVPVIVPDGVNPENILESSEFNKVWQVVRALKAQDDQFVERCRIFSAQQRSGRADGGGGEGAGIGIDISSLPDAVRERLTTKVINIGTGTAKEILTEAAIIAAAREYYRLHGRLPTCGSTESVPSMPNETWRGIKAAGQYGIRGLTKGRTLAVILGPLRRELRIVSRIDKEDLKESHIIVAARAFYKLHGKLPTGGSTESVPEMPDETWVAINSAGQYGIRGLTKGRTLAVILAPLRRELGIASWVDKEDLEESHIIAAARVFYKLHGKLPTSGSTESVPEMPDETWGGINAAGQCGIRGLTKGRTLAVILGPLRRELGIVSWIDKEDLEESHIIAAARVFYKLHGKLPTGGSTESVPEMPDETWKGINSAGQYGRRGLTKGRTLSIILAPLRKELKSSK